MSGGLSHDAVMAQIRAQAEQNKAQQPSAKDDLAAVLKMMGADSLANMLKSSGVSNSTPSSGLSNADLPSCQQVISGQSQSNTCRNR